MTTARERPSLSTSDTGRQDSCRVLGSHTSGLGQIVAGSGTSEGAFRIGKGAGRLFHVEQTIRARVAPSIA